MSLWQRWMRQPQDVLLRRMLFQVHLWTGIALGLYLVVLCLSGSVIVYRSELSRAFSPQPRIVTVSGEAMDEEELTSAARRAHPGYEVIDLRLGLKPDHAAEVMVERDGTILQRLIDPYTGEDLGYVLPAGYRFTQWLLLLHDTLLLEDTGSTLNALGALLLVVLSTTGAVIWWPGIRSWRRSIAIETKASWKRLNWTLHSALGFWFFAFILIWGISGIYLSYPEPFVNLADYYEPIENHEPGTRISDRIVFWLTYLHFGRFRGRLPGCGPSCDQALKAVWAVVGLVPVAMFVTGALMWWNRVLRPSVRRSENSLTQVSVQAARK